MAKKKLKKGVHGTYKLIARVGKDGTVRIKQSINHLTAHEVNSILNAAKDELAKEVGGPDPSDMFANMLMGGLKDVLKSRKKAREEENNNPPEGTKDTHHEAAAKEVKED